MARKITPIRDVLGYVVLYGATSTSHVTYERAVRCMLKHGVNDEYLNPPTPRRAFRRSVKDTEREGENKFALNAGSKASKGLKDSKGSKAAVIYGQRQKSGVLDFEFDRETVVELKAGKLITSGKNAEFVKASFALHSNNLIGDDLRNMARKAVEAMGGISLRGSDTVRDTGGVYFVPSTYAKKLEALAKVLDELEIGYLKTFAVLKGRIEQKALFSSSTLHVENELAGIEADLENLSERVSSAENAKRRLERLKQLQLEYAELTEMISAAKPLLKKINDTIVKADNKISELRIKRDARKQNRR